MTVYVGFGTTWARIYTIPAVWTRFRSQTSERQCRKVSKPFVWTPSHLMGVGRRSSFPLIISNCTQLSHITTRGRRNLAEVQDHPSRQRRVDDALNTEVRNSIVRLGRSTSLEVYLVHDKLNLWCIFSMALKQH